MNHADSLRQFGWVFVASQRKFSWELLYNLLFRSEMAAICWLGILFMVVMFFALKEINEEHAKKIY